MSERNSDSNAPDSRQTLNPLTDDLYLVVLIAIGMLLWALIPTNPYGYYVFLR